MNANTKHAAQRTPGPWITYYDDSPMTPIKGWKIKADDDIQSPIGLVPETLGGNKNKYGRSPHQEANAAFIVQACNAHGDLVAALEFIASQSTWNEDMQHVPQMRRTKADISNILDRAIEQARAALDHPEQQTDNGGHNESH